MVLSTEISPELHREGLVREVTSHIQGIRRDLDLGYVQRIRLSLLAEGELAQALSEHSGHIQSETLATELSLTEVLGGEVRELDIEGQSIKIGVEPL